MRKILRTTALFYRSRSSLLILFILFSTSAQALELVRIYGSNCSFQTGALLASDPYRLTILDLNGEIKTIDRFEIKGLALYSVRAFPAIRLFSLKQEELPPVVKIEAKVNGDITTLAEGWPNGYNNEFIQIFGLDLKEYQVRKDNIWMISEDPELSYAKFSTSPNVEKAHLEHPLSFSRCGYPEKGLVQRIKPYSTFERPIAVKHYLDQLIAGRQQLADYKENQIFYPVPFVYKNITRLGTWALLGSRYSNAGSRRINFLPNIIDEYSEGPFSYQRVIRTGVSPIEWILHGEPILNSSFDMKSAYVHFRLFFDPSILLLGERYNWSEAHLDGLDDRLASVGGLRFGFDLSYFSLFLTWNTGPFAVRDGDFFANLGYSASGVGFSANFDPFHFEFIQTYNLTEEPFRSGPEFSKLDLAVSRVNLGYKSFLNSELLLSYIVRVADYKLLTHESPVTLLNLTSLTNELVAQASWDLNFRWRIYGRTMIETNERGVAQKDKPKVDKKKNYFKFALGSSLAF